jgi:hypothetical protein
LLEKIVIKPITDSSVRLTNLKTGDAHLSNNVAPKDVSSVKTDSTLTYQEVPGLAFGSLVPNRKEGFVFNEARYVKAVSMALDRDELLAKAFFGIGTVGYGTIAPSHFAYDANFKPFEKAEPDGAKALVSAVGKGALSVEFLVPSGDPALLQQATLIQAQLRKADIDAQIVQLEFAQIMKQQADHVFKGMTYVGWSGRIDPDGNTYDFNYTAAKQRRELFEQRRRPVARRLAADEGRSAAQRRVPQSRTDLPGRRSARLARPAVQASSLTTSEDQLAPHYVGDAAARRRGPAQDAIRFADDCRHLAVRPAAVEPDLVPQSGQLVANFARDARLDAHSAGVGGVGIERAREVRALHRRRVQGFLKLHAKVDHVEEELQRPLILLIAAWRAKRHPTLAVAHRE